MLIPFDVWKIPDVPSRLAACKAALAHQGYQEDADALTTQSMWGANYKLPKQMQREIDTARAAAEGIQLPSAPSDGRSKKRERVDKESRGARVGGTIHGNSCLECLVCVCVSLCSSRSSCSEQHGCC